jgi:hypothetical protein
LTPVESSKLPTPSHPASDPEKTTGWQSCPAATMAFSDVQVKVTNGKDVNLMLKKAPPG